MISSIALSTFITLGGWSVHSHKQYQTCKGDIGKKSYSIKENCKYSAYNSNHKGLIAEYKGFTIGTYKNSYYKRTNLIGYTHRIKSFSIVAAYGTGYNIKDLKDSCPIKIGKECLLISLGYTYRNAKISYLGGALSLAIEFSL